ncbi:hypothetical protein ACLOJK_033635 [Asimina triloba]
MEKIEEVKSDFGVKIEELESDFGELVGCVSDLKEFQVAETTQMKLFSHEELRQVKERIYLLEEAESKREFKLNYLDRNV